MAETQPSNILPSVMSVVPQKRRPEELDNVTSASSPPIPDMAASTKNSPAVKEKTSMHRAPREKKETLKKREAKGGALHGDSRSTADKGAVSGAKRKAVGREETPSSLAPLRYKLPPPSASDYVAPKGPVLAMQRTIQGPDGQEIPFYKTLDHVFNRKGFRYTHCVADPTFPSLQYRQSETAPFTARLNFEDSSSHILFDESGKLATTDKGFRMVRANVCVREGRWYWECKVVSGIRAGSNPSQTTGTGDATRGDELETRGHVRMGWARREASLDAPVGFDAYSYGLRDVAGQKMHMSRPKDFFSPGEDAREGDVIGFEIWLPPLALHCKIVEGRYNPAVDVGTEVHEDDADAPDVVRDRIPIRYKSHLYFEQFDYHSTKELEDLMNPSPMAASGGSASSKAPHPTHPLVALRTLPNSYIKIYKNGRLMGTAFDNLLAFLPPASKPLAQGGAREGLDDGMLGYFPAVSVFRGGAAEVNFGPDFWYPPAEHVDVAMDNSSEVKPIPPLRPISERYDEQIAEDMMYDLVDEVDFWLQDGGSVEGKAAVGVAAPADPGQSHLPLPGSSVSLSGGVKHAGEIKEIVQEDD